MVLTVTDREMTDKAESGIFARITVLTQKIENNMVSHLEKGDTARTTSLLLKELRTYVYSIDGTANYLFNGGFVEKLLSTFLRCLGSRSLASEIMRMITTFLRLPHLFTASVQLLRKYDSLKVILVVLRRYIADQNVHTQCIEIIDVILEDITVRGNQTNARDAVNFLVMYGAISSLPRCLKEFESIQQNISTQRVLSVLVFFLKNAPANVGPKIASENNFSTVHVLLKLIKDDVQLVKAAACTLIIGYILVLVAVSYAYNVLSSGSYLLVMLRRQLPSAVAGGVASHLLF